MDVNFLEELIDLAYWRKSIHACTGDGIASYEPDEIKYLEIAPAMVCGWTTGHTLKTRCWGDPIRVDKEQKEVEMFGFCHGKWNGAKWRTNNRLFTSAYSTICWPLSLAPRPTQLHWHPSGKMHFELSTRDDFVYTTKRSNHHYGGWCNIFQNWSVILLQSTTIYQGIGKTISIYIDFSKST